MIVAIDELADLVQTGGPAILESLGRLVQRGREAGIHVIGATQKPSSAVIGPLVKANFPVRLVGHVVSAEDARVAAGVGGTGAEKLTGRGDFVAVYGPGLIRFQAAYISVNEIEASRAAIGAGSSAGMRLSNRDRPATTRPAPRANHSLSVLDSAVYALPGVDR